MELALGFGAIFSLLMLAMFGLMLAAPVLWIWAFVDVVRREEWMFASGDRTLWALVVGLGGPIGAIIYLTVGRPRPAKTF